MQFFYSKFTPQRCPAEIPSSAVSDTLSLWCPLLPYGYSYKASCARPGRAERQSARMSKITNDCLTRSGTGCFIPVPIRQHWASKGYGQGRVSIGSHT